MRHIVGVVVIVLVILLGIGLLLPALLGWRETAARKRCMWNLAQIGTGLKKHHEVHEALPIGTLPNSSLPPERRLSWYVRLLPDIGQDALFQQFDRDKPWDAAENRQPARTTVPLFLCPAELEQSGPGPRNVTHYVGMAGVGADAPLLPRGDRKAGCFGYTRKTSFADVTDGISQTMLGIETGWQNGPWAAGGPATVRGLDPPQQPYLGKSRPFGGIHRSGASKSGGPPATVVMVLFVDGAVHVLAGSIHPRILEALATIAGNEDPAGADRPGFFE